MKELIAGLGVFAAPALLSKDPTIQTVLFVLALALFVVLVVEPKFKR